LRNCWLNRKFRMSSGLLHRLAGPHKFRGQSKIAENVGNSTSGGDFTLTPPIRPESAENIIVTRMKLYLSKFLPSL
ncbi:MAG: hypothetical protein OXN26_07285, partial [Gammaproteobacteria bacterium]|nr:hypothetical protein [Gammaproteobacteria bacterium]